MKKAKLAGAISAVLLGSTMLSSNVAAEGRLVVYCSAQNTMCEQETLAFEKKYNIKTSFIRGGTGSILAKIDAEKDNPQGDVWYGGTLDPHSQAGEMGLLEPYKSPNLQFIPDKLKDPGKVKGNYSSAIYLGILGFGVNTEKLAKMNIPVPKCWKDLTDPRLKK
ncbi:Fe(3+) transport system periplasmic ferric iron-binding protein AfuA-1 [Pasteurella bettyae]|nr:Fe(3+) transport system periplasmic ferric iron-binding protein AfuA-1 [Pasteurella bettyae]